MAPQVSKLQQDGLEPVPTGGGGLRRSAQTIWSPYGPYSPPRTGPFSHLPAAQPPTPKPGDPKGKLWLPSGLRKGEQLAPGLCLRSAHHLVAGAGLAMPSWRMESRLAWAARIKVLGSAKEAGWAVASFKACRRDFPRRSSSPTLLWSPLGRSPRPLPRGCCCLQGLFGSSALHTLSLAASQGWPQGPDYATSTTSQPSQAGWGFTPNQRTPPPNPLPRQHHRDEMRLLLQLFTQCLSHVLTKEGQVLDQRQTQRKT